MPELTVAIPAYFEYENLRVLLPRLVATLDALGTDYEIVVVDAMTSLDLTEVACRENGVRYVNRQGGNTYGDAIRTAIDVAESEYLIFMDGDGSHAPEFLPSLFKHRNDYDVVIASRYVAGGATDNRWELILMSRIVNIVYGVVLGLKCKDISNSYKLYRVSDLKAIKLNASNFEVVEEILIKLVRNRPDLRILEVPFTFNERMFGHTKRNLFLFALSYIYTLIKLRFS